MKLTIAAVGKLKEEYLKEASKYFSSLISNRCQFEIIEIPDEKNIENASESSIEIIKNKEGTALIKKFHHSQYVIALAIDGKKLDTQDFKNKILECISNNKNDIVFVIGGSLGLSNEVLNRADFKISFSPMTFPHQLMRIILMEQILICI